MSDIPLNHRVTPTDDTGHWSFLLELTPWKPDWHAKAKCRGLDTNMFYPAKGEATSHIKQVCGGCPVRQECLDAAIESQEPGIWGGTSVREREAMTGKRRSLGPVFSRGAA